MQRNHQKIPRFLKYNGLKNFSNKFTTVVSIEQAKLMPKYYNIPNDMLVTMAVLGDQEAREERVIRDIMATDEIRLCIYLIIFVKSLQAHPQVKELYKKEVTINQVWRPVFSVKKKNVTTENHFSSIQCEPTLSLLQWRPLEGLADPPRSSSKKFAG